VAGEGLSERKLIVESAKLKGREKALNAEVSSSQRVEKPGEGKRDWLDCDENMGKGNISLAEG
jgi:hypothetical protein